MNKRRASWIVGVLALSLLVAGVVVLAGNGVGRGASGASQTATCQATRDADGDGTPNGQDPDWVAPCDGSGYGATLGSGTECPGTCPNAGAAACTGQGRGFARGGGRTCGGGRS